MNASTQTYTPELACKIAQVGFNFKDEFPDATVDLSPWLQDAETQRAIDPDSIDISFHFLGFKLDCQSHTILVEIRFSDALWSRSAKIIGIDMSGHTCSGQQWRLSTVGEWSCEGDRLPTPYAQKRLRRFCQTTLGVFQGLHISSLPARPDTETDSDLDFDFEE